jgi:hypothetical protein
MQNKVAVHGKIVCNIIALWTCVGFLFICAFIAITTSSVAIDKEKEYEKTSINSFVNGGELDVNGVVVAESFTFENQMTEDLSNDEIEVTPIEISLEYKFSITFPTSDISVEPISVKLNRLGNFVNVYISEWEGTCFNETSVLISKEPIPIEFIMTEDDTPVRTYAQFTEVVNDSVVKAGAFFIASNGKINLVANLNDFTEKWGGECSLNYASITYPIKL